LTRRWSPRCKQGAYAKQPDARNGDNVDVYTGTVTPKQLDELRNVGVDADNITTGTDGSATEVETVLTERQPPGWRRRVSSWGSSELVARRSPSAA